MDICHQCSKAQKMRSVSNGNQHHHSSQTQTHSFYRIIPPKPHFSNSRADQAPTAEKWQLPQLWSQEAQHACGPHRECVLIFIYWDDTCGHRHWPCVLRYAYIYLLRTFQPTAADRCCVLGQGHLVASTNTCLQPAV